MASETAAKRSPVADNLRRRAAERTGAAEPSSRRTAMVVQGGGLRSVATCGTVAALNHLGLTHAFDRVYAVSSGAVNAAYFLTEEADIGITVYLDDVLDHRFLNYLRWRKIMDLEYFFDDVVNGLKQHDTAAMRAHATELLVITTDEVTGEPRWFSSHDESVNFYDALKASCSLPVIYPHQVDLAGRTYIDGGYNEPLPLLTPLAEGVYSDILVLMSRHVSERYSRKSSITDRLLEEQVLRRKLSAPVFELYKKRSERYNRAVEITEKGVYEHENGRRTRVGFVCPDRDKEVSRFDKNQDRLADVAYSCWLNTFRFFGVEEGSDRASFDAMYREAQEKARKANSARAE